MQKKRILLIEDETDIREPLAESLRDEGYDVATAADGQSGLSQAQNSSPDLIILDLKLPKLSGEEICKAIREDEDMGQPPIIMLTGKTGDVDRIVGKVLGANLYMTKPFDLQELFRRVHQFAS